MNLQGELFYQIRELLPGVDEKWFIREFMKCRIRRMLDAGNYFYASHLPNEVLNYFLCERGPGDIWSGEYIPADYQRGETWGGMLPMWAGMAYSLYQWEYEVPSAELIDILPLEVMERIYAPLHTVGWDVVTKKIHDSVL
jgi:hypothetical protein